MHIRGRRRVPLLAVLVLLSSACPGLAAQTAQPSQRLTAPGPSGPVDIRKDPAFRVVLQNPAVRISRIEISSRTATLLDQHPHDYLLLSLDAGDLQISGYGSTYDLPMQPGEMQVMKAGWPHRIANRGASPARLLQVEIARPVHPERPLCGLTAAPCGGMKFGKTEQGEYSEGVLFETDTTRVLRIELGPGGTLLTHQDRRDHVLLPLGESHVEVDGEEKPANQPLWQPGGFARVHNLSKEALRAFVIEIK